MPSAEIAAGVAEFMVLGQDQAMPLAGKQLPKRAGRMVLTGADVPYDLRYAG
jgi:hypothetical protein